MSRSNPELDRKMPKNPARYILRWKGGKEGGGKWEAYDREKEERSELAPKLAFIVLDELKTATGYSQSRSCGVYATEVRNNGDSLRVFHQGDSEPFAEGPWASIRDVVTSARNGGKYAVAVYALVKIGAKNELAKIMMFRASLSPWFKFTGENNVKAQDAVVYCSGVTLNTEKKDVNYYEPVFQLRKMTKPESIQEAVEADSQLQRYFAEYFAMGKHVASEQHEPSKWEKRAEPDPEPDIESEEEPEEEELPF